MRPPTDLGVLIQTVLIRNGWSTREVGGRLGAPTMVANVIAGRVAIPLGRIDEWADALRLHGDERVRFKALAESAAAKRARRSKPYVEELERRVTQLEADLRDAEQRLEKRDALLAEMRRALDELRRRAREQG